MDAEQPLGIRPALDRREARGPSQLLELADRVLVGGLGVDRLPLPEAELAAVDRDRLRLHALQMHLDTAGRLVVEGAVAKRRKIKVGAELAIDAGEQVEVEPGGDAARIVVRGVESGRVL